jgi:hypothetical protein
VRGGIGRIGRVLAANRESRRIGRDKSGEPKSRERHLQRNRIGGETGGKLPPKPARSRSLHGHHTPAVITIQLGTTQSGAPALFDGGRYKAPPGIATPVSAIALPPT